MGSSQRAPPLRARCRTAGAAMSPRRGRDVLPVRGSSSRRAGWNRSIRRPAARSRSSPPSRPSPPGRAAGPAAAGGRARTRPRTPPRSTHGEQPERPPSRSPRDHLAEQFDVVVSRPEQALVERLLKRPQGGRDRAGRGTAQGAVHSHAGGRAESVRESPAGAASRDRPPAGPRSGRAGPRRPSARRTSARSGSRLRSARSRRSFPRRSAVDLVELARQLGQVCPHPRVGRADHARRTVGQRPVPGGGQPRRGKCRMSPASQRRSRASCDAAQRNIRRGTGCSSRSPHASASSTACIAAAGNRARVRPRLSSARDMLSDPWMRRPSSFRAGTVPPRKPAGRSSRVEPGNRSTLVLDALALEHQPRRLTRMRQRQRVELCGHRAHPIPAGRETRKGRQSPPLSMRVGEAN